MRLVQIKAAGALWIMLAPLAFGQGGLGKAKLTGTVTDDNGNPITAAKIFLRLVDSVPYAGFLGFSAERRQESASFETTTDKKGRWSFTGLATGVWEITAYAKNYFPASRKCSVFQLQVNKKVPLQLEKSPEPVTKDLTELVLLEKGNEFYYMKKFDQAIAFFQIYLRAHPEVHMVALSIGDCCLEKGDLDKAIEQFSQVVEKTSKDPRDKVLTARALAGIGECWYKKNNLDQAQEFFKRSLDFYPEDELVVYNLAELHFSRQRVDDAIRYYSMAARAAPSWSDAQFKLGNVYLNKADYQKAKEAFQRFLKLEPTSTRAASMKNILKDLDKIKNR